MLNAIKSAFTGKDNNTIDLGRVLWAKMSLVFCGASLYAIYNGQEFDASLFGIGAGAVLAAGGAGLAVKAKTEPDNG